MAHIDKYASAAASVDRHEQADDDDDDVDVDDGVDDPRSYSPSTPLQGTSARSQARSKNSHCVVGFQNVPARLSTHDYYHRHLLQRVVVRLRVRPVLAES